MNRFIKTIVLLLSFAFIFSNCNANNNIKNSIDSLKTLLAHNDSKDSAAVLYSKIARQYYNYDSIPLAVFYYNNAADLYLLNKNYSKYCIQLETIGVMYAFSNNNKMALQYFFKALKVAENYKLSRKQQITLAQNIGIMFNMAEEWNDGISILRKCEPYFESDSCNFKDYLIVNQTDLGHAYQNINKIDSALYFYNLALSNTVKFKSQNYIDGIYLNIGDLYVIMKDYIKAKYYYNLSIDLFKKKNNNRDYYRAIYGIGTAESGEKHYDIAIKHFNNAIAFFEKSKDFLYARDAYKHICNIYEAKNDLKNVVKYNQLYSNAKDSISAINLKKNISELKMQYELDKIEYNFKINIELLNKKIKLKNYRWFSYLSVLSILLISISALYVRHRSRQKLIEAKLINAELKQKQLESEVTYKTKELENLAMHIMQKNEFLEQIKTDIKNLKENTTIETHQKINSISFKITQTIRKNKDSEKLKNYIDQIHEDFLTVLTNKFPDLTEKEKRLCILLKLNFNTKEISSLNNVSEDAIIKARHRMRKKMGLSTDENLSEFILKI